MLGKIQDEREEGSERKGAKEEMRECDSKDRNRETAIDTKARHKQTQKRNT